MLQFDENCTLCQYITQNYVDKKSVVKNIFISRILNCQKVNKYMNNINVLEQLRFVRIGLLDETLLFGTPSGES